MEDPVDRSLTFANNLQRGLMGVYLGVLALIALVGVFNPGNGGLGLQVTAAVGALVFAALAIRFATGSCIFATDSGVQVRAALRRYDYQWEEIRGFRSETGVVGAAAYRRKVLAIDLADGRTLSFRALNCSPKGGWVDDAARFMNDRLSAAHS